MTQDVALALAGAVGATVAAVVNVAVFVLCRRRRHLSPTVPVVLYIGCLAACYAAGSWAVVAGLWTRLDYSRVFSHLTLIVFLTVWVLPAHGLLHAASGTVPKPGPPE